MRGIVEYESRSKIRTEEANALRLQLQELEEGRRWHTIVQGGPHSSYKKSCNYESTAATKSSVVDVEVAPALRFVIFSIWAVLANHRIGQRNAPINGDANQMPQF